MTREQYEAMRARLAEISYYEPAVIDEIAEQALEGVEGLLARVDALEAENTALRDDFNTAHEYSKAAEKREFEAREEVRRLQAENAALRARAVPELRFNAMGVAESGQFTGCVADNGDWALGMYLNGILISIEDDTGGKTAMDAAFLRLVGVKS